MGYEPSDHIPCCEVRFYNCFQRSWFQLRILSVTRVRGEEGCGRYPQVECVDKDGLRTRSSALSQSTGTRWRNHLAGELSWTLFWSSLLVAHTTSSINSRQKYRARSGPALVNGKGSPLSIPSLGSEEIVWPQFSRVQPYLFIVTGQGSSPLPRRLRSRTLLSVSGHRLTTGLPLPVPPGLQCTPADCKCHLKITSSLRELDDPTQVGLSAQTIGFVDPFSKTALKCDSAKSACKT